MATITTKMNVDQPGYFMQSNKIATGKVIDVTADQGENGIKITNKVQQGDATIEVDEADIYASVGDLANDLVAKFEAANPPAAAQ